MLNVIYKMYHTLLTNALRFCVNSHRRCKSEYASNFAAPQKFDYTMGAWIGADPPHIVNRPVSIVNSQYQQCCRSEIVLDKVFN